jgi:hypothetical protein
MPSVGGFPEPPRPGTGAWQGPGERIRVTAVELQAVIDPHCPQPGLQSGGICAHATHTRMQPELAPEAHSSSSSCTTAVMPLYIIFFLSLKYIAEASAAGLCRGLKILTTIVSNKIILNNLRLSY